MNRVSTARCVLAGLGMLLLLSACKRGEQEPAAPQSAGQTGTVAKVAGDAESRPAATRPGRPALKVTTLDGKPYDLGTHRGHWVVVNFWATWCAPCLKEMPELSALDAMREHVEVIGLAYDDIEPAQMRTFLQAHPVVYPIAILDVYAPPKDFADPRGLPTTYLIAPDGKIAKHFLGPVTAKEIDAAIAAAGGPEVAGEKTNGKVGMH